MSLLQYFLFWCTVRLLQCMWKNLGIIDIQAMTAEDNGLSSENDSISVMIGGNYALFEEFIVQFRIRQSIPSERTCLSVTLLMLRLGG